MTTPLSRGLVVALAFALALAGCATPPRTADEVAATKPAPPPLTAPIDRAVEERILAMNPERVGAADVAVLEKGPAPRIILLHGGIYPVHLIMMSFGHFLAGMGYPQAQIRDPGDREWSYSPYQDSTELAGLVAWAYERDGMRPMMIGHSQGGIQAVKVLRELAGQMSPSIAVWSPITHATESRTTIVDPLTGKERPVVGLKVSYVSAVGAGGAALLLPNQWNMIGHLESIPDSVDEFTGFVIGLDTVAWTPVGAGENRYRPNGTAIVRNVELPAWYSHLTVPVTQDLARDEVTREWVNAYFPGSKADPSGLPGDADSHVLWAADVWYSIKKHWVIEAQRLIGARRQQARQPAAVK